MATVTSHYIDQYYKTQGVYVISSPLRKKVYKVGMSGGSSVKGFGGSKAIGNRLAQHRTSMLDVLVHMIIEVTDHQSVSNHAYALEKHLHHALSKRSDTKRLKFPDEGEFGNESEWFKTDLTALQFTNVIYEIAFDKERLTYAKYTYDPIKPLHVWRFTSATTLPRDALIYPKKGTYDYKHSKYAMSLTGVQTRSGKKQAEVTSDKKKKVDLSVEHLQGLKKTLQTTRSGRVVLTSGAVHNANSF